MRAGSGMTLAGSAADREVESGSRQLFETVKRDRVSLLDDVVMLQGVQRCIQPRYRSFPRRHAKLHGPEKGQASLAQLGKELGREENPKTIQ